MRGEEEVIMFEHPKLSVALHFVCLSCLFFGIVVINYLQRRGDDGAVVEPWRETTIRGRGLRLWMRRKENESNGEER